MLEVVATDAHMHQERLRIRLDGNTVLINDRRMIRVIPRLRGALILGQIGTGVKWKMVREDGFINPKEFFPPILELIYLSLITL